MVDIYLGVMVRHCGIRTADESLYLADGKVIFECFPRILDDLDGSHQTDNRFFCRVKQA